MGEDCVPSFLFVYELRTDPTMIDKCIQLYGEQSLFVENSRNLRALGRSVLGRRPRRQATSIVLRYQECSPSPSYISCTLHRDAHLHEYV